MPWPLSNDQERRRLERAFTNRNIPFDTPGFYDRPNFLTHEQKDPRFLELYARYIETRQYGDDYLANAAAKIDIAANALVSAVKADGRLGACVDASGMLGRMLDRLGIWNYVAKATLTITFPSGSGITDRYFWSFDEGSFAAPHAIVVAPPFGVVDVTVRHQIYEGSEGDYLPPLVMARDWLPAKWTPEDLANPEIRAALKLQGMSFDTFLQRQNSSMGDVMRTLPPRQVKLGDTILKYVVVAVGGTIEPLEEITGYKPSNRTALQIFEQDIFPKIK